MARPRRVLRLQQLILETVAGFLQREVRDPRIGMVSVTRVRLSPDLSSATIGWSCLGDEAIQRRTARGLEDAAPAVQRAVAKVMRTRVTPHVHFRHDDTLERAQALEGIFERLREERQALHPEQAADAGDGGETPPAPEARGDEG